MQAHSALEEGARQYPDNAELLWRLAKSHRNLATLAEKRADMDAKKQHIFKGYNSQLEDFICLLFCYSIKLRFWAFHGSYIEW